MLLSEPRQTRWDLRWRQFGAEIRICPIFWATCVLVGVIFYRDPDIGGVGMFCFWVIAALVTLLAHAAGHILTARLFGARVRIPLSGLGGQVHGLDECKRWQRVLILLAGSLGNLVIFGILWAIADPERTPLPIDRLGPNWTNFVVNGIAILMIINAFWALLNVLPLWPLDGGRVAVEIGAAICGRRGQTLALLVSLAVCLLLSVTVVGWAREKLINRFDPRYIVYLLFFCIQALYCYFFWLSTFRALWGDPVPLNRV